MTVQQAGSVLCSLPPDSAGVSVETFYETNCTKGLSPPFLYQLILSTAFTLINVTIFLVFLSYEHSMNTFSVSVFTA